MKTYSDFEKEAIKKKIKGMAVLNVKEARTSIENYMQNLKGHVFQAIVYSDAIAKNFQNFGKNLGVYNLMKNANEARLNFLENFQQGIREKAAVQPFQKEMKALKTEEKKVSASITKAEAELEKERKTRDSLEKIAFDKKTPEHVAGIALNKLVQMDTQILKKENGLAGFYNQITELKAKQIGKEFDTKNRILDLKEKKGTADRQILEQAAKFEKAMGQIKKSGVDEVNKLANNTERLIAKQDIDQIDLFGRHLEAQNDFEKKAVAQHNIQTEKRVIMESIASSLIQYPNLAPKVFLDKKGNERYPQVVKSRSLRDLTVLDLSETKELLDLTRQEKSKERFQMMKDNPELLKEKINQFFEANPYHKEIESSFNQIKFTGQGFELSKGSSMSSLLQRVDGYEKLAIQDRVEKNKKDSYIEVANSKNLQEYRSLITGQQKEIMEMEDKFTKAIQSNVDAIKEAASKTPREVDEKLKEAYNTLDENGLKARSANRSVVKGLFERAEKEIERNEKYVGEKIDTIIEKKGEVLKHNQAYLVKEKEMENTFVQQF